MNITLEKVRKDLIKEYKKGKGANAGGLEYIKEPSYKGLLFGFWLNMRVGIDPQTMKIVKTEIV